MPFAPIEAPPFAMSMRWDRQGLIDYLGTWSAVRRHDADRGTRALDRIEASLADAWPGGEPREVRFPLSMLAGRG
jgi:hypothetical protein